MTHFYSVAKFGYYPLPVEALEALKGLFVRNGSEEMPRLLDPCAGEGVALQNLAEAWNMNPFANEYESRRSAKCVEKFGVLNAMRGDFYDLDATARGFQVVYLNPPFQSDASYGRTEADFLNRSWHFVAFGGYLIFVSYTHHLSEDVCEMMYTNSSQVDVYRVPGQDLGNYMMTVCVCKVKDGQPYLREKDKEAADALVERALKNYQINGWLKSKQALTEEQQALLFTDITTVTEPRYVAPAPRKWVHNRLLFSQKTYGPEEMVAMVNGSNPEELDPMFQVYTRAPEIKTEKKVVVMPRFRQLTGLLASGLFNGAAIETEKGVVLVRAVTNQVERLIQSNELDGGFDEDGNELEAPTETVQVYRTAPETRITLLYANGTVENITEDAALRSFIRENRKALMEYVERVFVADYNFDFMGGATKKVLDGYRIIKGAKKLPLYESQKHVISASLARLAKERTVIICGQPGVGKTSIGSVLLDLMKYRTPDDEDFNLRGLMAQRHRIRPDQFSVVVCPPHLVSKWTNEMRGLIPNAYIGSVASGEGDKPIQAVMEFIRGCDNQPADTLKVLIISREMVKVGEAWEPAFHVKTARNGEEFLASPTTGLEIIKAGSQKKQRSGRVGEGTAVSLASLKSSRMYMGIDRSKPAHAKPVRGAKIHKFPAQYEDVKTATERAKPYAIKEPEYAAGIVQRALNTIRANRRSHDAAQPRHDALWQETRKFSALPYDLRAMLAEAAGIQPHYEGHTPRMMPLPDLVEKHLGSVAFAHAQKSPRAGIEGVAKFLAEHYGDRIYGFILDEAHESASADSAQGGAALVLAMAAKKVVYMTGTLYKGVASSLYAIEFAINKSLQEKYPWGSIGLWVKDMGVLERTVKTKKMTNGKQSGASNKTEIVKEMPGASPALLATVIEHTIFIGIKDLGNIMPEFVERAVPVQMDAAMASIYTDYIDGICHSYLMERMQEGDGSFMGAYFQASLNWANWPYAEYPVIHNRWVEDEKTGERTKFPEVICVIPSMGDDYVSPKEQKLLNMIAENIANGQGSAIYFRQTGKKPGKDMLGRMSKMITDNVQGAKPVVLTTSVSTGKREAWLTKQKEGGANVLLCNPNLVKTGLDLLEYPNIIWYEIDYSLPTVDQASHRAWRPGQTKTCFVDFLFYVQDEIDEDTGSFEVNTVEAKGIVRVGAKQGAANFLYGDENASLSAMSARGESLQDMLAEDMGVGQVVDAAALFRKASDVTNEMVSDWTATAEDEETVTEEVAEEAQPVMDITPAAPLPYWPEAKGWGKKPAYRYIRKTDEVPDRGDQDGQQIEDVQVYVKLFNPAGSETWYILEYSPETRIATAYVVESGNFGSVELEMAEFAQVRGRFGLPMERDIHFTPCTLIEALRKEGHRSALAAFEAYLPSMYTEESVVVEAAPAVEAVETSLEDDVMLAITETVQPEPIPEKVADATERQEYWAKDVKRYGKPAISKESGLATFNAGNGRRVIWQKDNDGQYERRAWENGEVKHILRFAAKELAA